MPCSAKFSMALQTEILSIEISDFQKQIIFLKPFNLLLSMYQNQFDLSMFKSFMSRSYEFWYTDDSTSHDKYV